ncbi:MAG: PAS domain-containing protein [Victivallaceae bacterium]
MDMTTIVSVPAAVAVIATLWFLHAGLLRLRLSRAYRESARGFETSRTLLEQAAAIGKVYYFVLELENNTIEANTHPGIPRMLPTDAVGRMIDPVKWVVAEDVGLFKAELGRMMNGEVEKIGFSYRAGIDGVIRDCVLSAMLLAPDRGRGRIAGVIRDVTESERNLERLKDSDNMFRTLLERMAIPVVVKDVDNDFRYLITNRAFCDFYGAPRESILGRNDFELVSDPAIAKSFYQDDLAALESDEMCINERPFISPSGGLRYVMNTRGKVFLSNGRRLLIVFGIDITELKKARLEREERQALLQAVLDNIPVSVMVKDVDDDFRYLLWNKFQEQHSGVEASRVIGKNDFEVSFCDRQGDYFRQTDLDAVLKGSIRYEERLQTLDSRTVSFQTFKKVFSTPSGKQLMLSLATDITRQQEFIEQLNSYVRYEEITNHCLGNIILEQNFERNVGNLLEKVGGALGAVRALVIHYGEDAKIRGKTFFEWTAEGAEPGPDNLHQTNAGAVRIWAETLRRDRDIILPDIEALPQEWDAAKAFWRRRQVKAVLSSAIHIHDQLWGAVVVEFAETKGREFGSDIRLLHNAARIFSIVRERERRCELVAETRMRQQQIFENVLLPMVLLDLDGLIVLANSAIGKIWHTGVEDAIGRPCRDVLGLDESPMAANLLTLVIGDLKPHSVELRAGDRFLVATAQPIFDSVGKLVNVLLLFVDVTESNADKQHLIAAMEAAKVANRAKSIFLATMSHEIRTPLNAVIGFSELLKNESLPVEQRREYVESIHHAGSSLLQLINDILDLSRLEAEQLELAPQMGRLSALCDEISSIFRIGAKRKNLGFSLDCPERMPNLFLDMPRLRQVLFNIVGNAIKFTDRGSVTVRVFFSPRNHRTGRLRIDVTDTGVGIAEEFKARIFDPFVQQTDGRGRRLQDGSGLGLSISKRLIERMNGALSFVSTAGEGSCFTIELGEVVYEEERTLPEPEPVPCDFHSERVLKILLVDDMVLNLKVLALMLKSLNCECVLAGSGEQALALLEEQTFDLILTDLWMPEMDGEQLTREIRRRHGDGKHRIIAVTADTEAHNNFETKIFDRVLLKPVSKEKLRPLLAETAEALNAGTISER